MRGSDACAGGGRALVIGGGDAASLQSIDAEQVSAAPA